MNDKSKLTEIFQEQIDDLDKSLRKMIEEKEENICVMKELRRTCVRQECDLDKANENLSKYLEVKRSMEKVNIIRYTTTVIQLYQFQKYHKSDI